MAGNLWEWSSDWFSGTYYGSSPSSNPQGPSNGQLKTLRGGSWADRDYLTKPTWRTAAEPLEANWEFGFRCARSAVIPVVSATSLTTPVKPTLADFFKRCPSAEEIADVNSRLQLTFIGDPTAGTLVCTAAAGSADLTKLQMRAYQAIIIMKYLQFDQPLPWTSKQLYDWFTSAVNGVRFEYTQEYKDIRCCLPGGIIWYYFDQYNVLRSQDAWASGLRGPEITDEPGTGISWGPGLMEATAGLIHEARHNEGPDYYPHYCPGGKQDETLAEMGSYGIQYYFFLWVANHSDRAFLTAPGDYPNLYRTSAMYDAYMILRHGFCGDPTPTPGPIPTINP
jgi:hypothetical protein